MKLSGNYHYTILCEDAQMDTFIRSFLQYNDIGFRKIYTVPFPAGNGCGEEHVRRSVAGEVEILRRSNYLRQALVICIDADKYTCEERKKTLLKEIKKHNPMWSDEKEMVLFWVPKREIETWIEFFRGNTVDEDMSFNHSGKPVSCKKEAKLMADYCRNLWQGESEVLPSLKQAKQDYERVCELQDRKERCS